MNNDTKRLIKENESLRADIDRLMKIIVSYEESNIRHMKHIESQHKTIMRLYEKLFKKGLRKWF